MKSFEIVSDNRAIVKIDADIYSKDVITKVVYWLSRDFTIMQKIDGQDWMLSLESQRIENWNEVKKLLAQMLSDYQMREVITAETKDIRNILFIRAFANVEELLADEEV